MLPSLRRCFETTFHRAWISLDCTFTQFGLISCLCQHTSLESVCSFGAAWDSFPFITTSMENETDGLIPTWFFFNVLLNQPKCTDRSLLQISCLPLIFSYPHPVLIQQTFKGRPYHTCLFGCSLIVREGVVFENQNKTQNPYPLNRIIRRIWS